MNLDLVIDLRTTLKLVRRSGAFRHHYTPVRFPLNYKFLRVSCFKKTGQTDRQTDKLDATLNMATS